MNDNYLDTCGNTCLATGKTYAELDAFNIGTEDTEDWQYFVSEDAYRQWMQDQGRVLPTLQG